MVRAKFSVLSKSEPRKATRWNDDNTTSEVEVVDLSLTAVTSGSEENKSFYANTPTGSISLSTVNLAAAEQFEVGKQYYVDFTPAD